MSTLAMPMTLFVSNYLSGSVHLGNSHVAFGLVSLALLVAALGIVLNIQPTQTQRPRLATTRPALQH